MAESSIALRLRGLVLSATELKQLAAWPGALVEDYLNIVDNIGKIAVSVDVGGSSDVQTVTADYTTTGADGLILADASANPVTVSLDDSAVAGQSHVVKCIGDTFACLVGRNGNLIDGVAESVELFKDESLSVRADTSNDWWVF